MANDSAMQAFAKSLDHLQSGEACDFLRRKEFPAWIELASVSLLRLDLAALADAQQETMQSQFRVTQVQALARRLILSRETDLFATLCPLWQAFGTSLAICDVVEEAMRTALSDWPAEVRQLNSDPAGVLGFSAVCAGFVQRLRQVGSDDSTGVLGAAIRMSRIVAEQSHVGFPLVLRGSQSNNIRTGVWALPRQATETSICDILQTSLNSICSEVDELIGLGDRSAIPPLQLPDWLDKLVHVKGGYVETLESAGFALAMQNLASQSKRPLPFGIGFTGRWEDLQLRGVRDLTEKMQAARETGVFLFFVCRDPSEPVPTPIAGLRVVLLAEGLRLDEVVRLVNRVCADTGLTELRWREANSRLLSINRLPDHSRDLPDACEKNLCPVEFVGRDQALGSLRDARAGSAGQAGRRLLAVVAPPRSGKTTLLSKFAADESPFPCWFSFRQDQASRRMLGQLQKGLADQLTARFHVVQLSPAESANSADDRLNAVVQATAGPINLVIDGVDEAQTVDESRKVLEWLQQLPGVGLVVVGSQRSLRAALDKLDCDRLELRNDSEHGQADAHSFIERFASRFSVTQGLKEIAAHLSESRWIQGLSQSAGGNLWVLTEFLSAVERGQAGWPSCPDDCKLSPDIRVYCRNLMNDVLAGYSEPERSRIDRFLAFRAFMDDSPWAVQDVARLAGDDLANAPIGTWSGTGLLAQGARRVICFDGSRCQFENLLTHEAVKLHYQKEASRKVAERFIQFICEHQNLGDLTCVALAALPALLADIGDHELTCSALFNCPWLPLRMRMLGNQRKPIDTLLAELQSLIRSVPPDRKSAVNQMLKWLAGWGWAIDETPLLIDEWWDAAGDVSRAFFSPGNAQEANSTLQSHLVVPVAGPHIDNACYDMPWPAITEFHPAACEVFCGSQSHLVFATDRGDLLIYREGSDGYMRERFDRLKSNEKVYKLDGLPNSEFVALVRQPPRSSTSSDWLFESGIITGPEARQISREGIGRSDVRVWNIESRDSHKVVTERSILALGVLAGDEPRLLIIEADEGDAVSPHCHLRVLDLKGSELAAMSLPFVGSLSEDIEIVPFGSQTWATLGRRQGGTVRELKLYSLDRGRDAWRINEIQTVRLPSINGACSLPNERLAIIGSSDGESVLSVIDSAGKLVMRLPIYTTPDDARRRYYLPHAMDGSFLLDCRPVAWHAEFGVILCSDLGEHGNRIFSVTLEPEAIPRPLTNLLIQNEPKRKCVRSLRSGGCLVVFSNTAVVLGAGLQNDVQIERSRETIEIVGCRADGNIIICDGFADDDNWWRRSNYRVAQPPFCCLPTEVNCSSRWDEVRVTADGWELRWGRSRSHLLTGRQQAGDLRLCWDATSIFECEPEAVQILDVLGRAQGGAWIAVEHDRQISAVLLSPAIDGVEHIVPLSTCEQAGIKLRGASADLLVYDIISDADYVIERRIYDSDRAQLLAWDSTRVEPVLCMAGNAHLVFEKSLWGAFNPSRVYIHFAGADEIIAVPDLYLSCQSFVVRQDEDRIRIVSIIGELDGEWSLEVLVLRIDCSEKTVSVRSRETINIDSGEVAAWTRGGNHLVLAYKSGRIEVRRCDRLYDDDFAAIAFTLTCPQAVAIVARSEGKFLAASDGQLTWYDLRAVL